MKAISRKSNLNGKLMVPGSKSHTIRAVLLSAMADGKSTIRNPLPSNDCKAALKAAEAFGAKTKVMDGVWEVEGLNGKLHTPLNYVDTDNSGTATYFVAGMASLCEGVTFLTGDEQIRRRPIMPLVNALNDLGARCETSVPGSIAPPCVIKGPLKGGETKFDGFCSQFISAAALAAPLAENDTHIKVENPLEKPYLQMTIDWMKKYGVDIEVTPDYKDFKIEGRRNYKACESLVPSDWSGVAFPLVAAVITDSDLVIEGVDFNDCQGDKAVVDHLISMGADITKDIEGGKIIVKGGKKLKSGLSINLNDIPDSLPALSVAACFCEGKTTFTGLAHVRVKETDRVACMDEELSRLGAHIEAGPDYMVVEGGHPLKGCEVKSHGDHRIAMALAACGLACEGDMVIENAECASVSFPNFYDVMQKAGADITLE